MDTLERIISMASQQKLLPKIIYQLQSKSPSGKRQKFLQYQKLIKYRYGHQGKVPLKYVPEQALSDLQKLKIKIQKSINHQLDIDYFDKLKTRQGKIIPLYKNNPIQKVTYQTKQQFQIFKDFNENKFKKSYTRMFDDKLELKQVSLIRKKRNKTCATIQEEPQDKQKYFLPNPKFNSISKNDYFNKNQKNKSQKKLKKVKLRPLTQAIQLIQTPVNIHRKPSVKKHRPHIQKTKIGKMINDITQQKLCQKMIKIGSFPSSVSVSSISLTKQSFSKYLKNIYDRQVRILDFLEVKPALTMTQYQVVCTKLKLMPLQHIIFMTFLFYDFNNDGYLCENDIRRMKTLCEKTKNYLIEEDLKLILNYKDKLREKQLNHKSGNKNPQSDEEDDKDRCNNEEIQQNYLQLYKLPEITETTYFNWLKKSAIKKSQQQQRQRRQTIHCKTQNAQQQQLNNQQKQQDKEQTKNNKKFDLNPSILKFRNFHDENSKVRKYILNIKHNKTYISFNQFKKLYLQKSVQLRKSSSQLPVQSSRLVQSSLLSRNLSKKVSRIDSDKLEPTQKRSKVSIKPSIGERYKKDEQILVKTFLWYDIMDRIAGVRYQFLRYQSQ